jgi:hypothetical protein
LSIYIYEMVDVSVCNNFSFYPRCMKGKTMDNLITTLDIVSFIASIVSLILALVAIYLAFHQKKEADKINASTTNLLVEIRTDAKVISQIAMPELKAYGESMRTIALHNIVKPISDVTDVNNGIIKTDGTLKEEVAYELAIDLTGLKNSQFISIRCNKNYKFTFLLEVISHNFLKDNIPHDSYGERWILAERETSKEIKLEGKSDPRTLSDVGISSANVYKVVLLS